MSYPFGSTMAAFTSSSTNILSDADNAANLALRKTKREEMLSKQLPDRKRAALGTITNQTRVQPSRAAKQSTISETFGAFGQHEIGASKPIKNAFAIDNTSLSTQTFSIHVDEEIQGVKNKPKVHLKHETSQPKLVLHPAVTSLRTVLAPVASEPIHVESSNVTDSPMILDTSIEKRKKYRLERESRLFNVPEYSDEIYQYLREAERRNLPKPGYMRKQPDITNSMRSILIDWLVEVAEEYNVHRETLCLAVNYIDRFLSQMSVLRGKLQLVGAAAMFLAAKFEEIYPPEVSEFVYITDDTYTKKQVLRMEHLVLKVLSFDIAVPTINCFCERFVKQCNSDEQTESLAMYLGELTMVDSDPYLKYLPSVKAAAALCLANHTLHQEAWPEFMIESTGYRMENFAECTQDLYATFCKAPSHPQQAVREKYKASKYHQVSLLNPPATLPFIITSIGNSALTNLS